MLNFQKPSPLVGTSVNFREKSIGEWLVQKEARTSVFMTDSCSILDIRKKSSLRSLKSETCFCLKVKRLMLEFLILKMSHKKRVSSISVSFAIAFFFKIGFPQDASNFWSKIKLNHLQKQCLFCDNHQYLQLVFVD